MQRLDLSGEPAPPEPFDRLRFKRGLRTSLSLATAAWLTSVAAFVAIPILLFLLSPGFLFVIPALGISLAVYGAIVSWSTRTQRLGRRYIAANAAEQIKRDSRPPILYLRSFSSEYVNNLERSDQVTEQEMLTLILKNIGPVIGIGHPNDELPPLGAAMEYVRGSDWQSVVVEFMRKAQLVVIEPGHGEGLSWEIATAREQCPPEKLIFSLLPFYLPDAASHNTNFEKFRASLEKSLKVSLPETDKEAMFLRFERSESASTDPKWKPKFVRQEGWNTSVYSFFETFGIDVTLVKIRETLRPVLAMRGQTLGVWPNFSNLAVSTIKSMVNWLFLFFLIAAIFFGLFVAAVCNSAATRHNPSIQNTFRCK